MAPVHVCNEWNADRFCITCGLLPIDGSLFDHITIATLCAGLTMRAHLITAALAEGKGSVTAAAKLLGFKHHNSLISLMQTRHQNLLPLRASKKKRRQSIMRPRRRGAPVEVIAIGVANTHSLAEALPKPLHVRVYSHHEIALAALQESNDAYACVFVATAEMVKAVRTVSTKSVIVLSNNPADEPDAWHEGADAFAVVPCATEQLRSIIKRTLEG